ncbi:hypothetical protein J7K24_00765 [bacterium]|nr:hypothetical protein [bacterium]
MRRKQKIKGVFTSLTPEEKEIISPAIHLLLLRKPLKVKKNKLNQKWM